MGGEGGRRKQYRQREHPVGNSNGEIRERKHLEVERNKVGEERGPAIRCGRGQFLWPLWLGCEGGHSTGAAMEDSEDRQVMTASSLGRTLWRACEHL